MIADEKLDRIVARLEFLEARLDDGAAVADLAALGREHAELKPVVAEIARLRGLLREHEEAERLRGDPEMRGAGRGGARPHRRRAARGRARGPGCALLPKDAADERSAILEIRAGTGGDEAALFAADLARMYQRLAEARGWRFEVVDAAPTELGGYRELVAEVSGKGVFAALKFESRRAPRAARAGDRGAAAASTPRPPPSRCCPRPRRSTSTSRRPTSASTPCAPRAPAASTSTPPTRRCASPTCRPASS